GTDQFRRAQAEGKLLSLPTGDGGALVFRNSPEEPVACALEISKALKNHPDLRVRMGIHSGPVNEIADLNEQANVAVAGINIAQRVMDCADAGHILLSRHVAEDLEHYSRWRPLLHELGECEVKHGAKISIINLYTEELGNPEPPQKFKGANQTETRPDRRATPITRTAVSVGYKRAMAVALGAIAVLGALWYLVLRPGSAIRETAKPITNVNFTQLTDLPGPEYFPSLSPDGKSLIYVSRASGNWDIYLQRVGGRNPTNLTKGSTADGRYLYFCSDRTGNMNIWRVPIAEKTGKLLGTPEAVTSGAGASTEHISLAQDGRRIAYVAHEEIKNLRKVTFDPSTEKIAGEPVPITRGSLQCFFPDPSPDGDWLAYYSLGKQEDIFIIHADGTDMRQLTDDVFKDREPRWSPDGKRIAFTSDRSGGSEIWAINRDGSGLQQLTQMAGAHHPVWSPDGTQMVYSIHTPKNAAYIFPVGQAWIEQSPVALATLSDTS